jgi:hypothetical protein
MGFESIKQTPASGASLERERNIEEIAGVKVAEMIRESNSFVVHDIVLEDHKPSANNGVVDTKRLSFADSLTLASGAEGIALSCSSIRYGTADRTFGLATEGTYGAPGVFLRGGTIIAANTHDSGTRARSLSERDLGGMPFDSHERTYVQKVLSDRDNRYNEIVVSHPEVAGVYFRLDSIISDEQRAELESSGTLAEIDERRDAQEVVIIKTGMEKRNVYGTDLTTRLSEQGWERLAHASQAFPIFIMTKDNKAFQISHIDKEKEELWLVKGPVDPTKLLAMAPGLAPGMQELKRQEAIDILAAHKRS